MRIGSQRKYSKSFYLAWNTLNSTFNYTKPIWQLRSFLVIMRVWVCLTTPKFVSWKSVCMPEIKLIIWFLLMIYFCFGFELLYFFYSRLFLTLIWLAHQTIYKLPWEIHLILINPYWTNLTTTIHNGSLTFFLPSMAISIQKAILIYPVVSEVMTIKELCNIIDWQ